MCDLVLDLGAYVGTFAFAAASLVAGYRAGSANVLQRLRQAQAQAQAQGEGKGKVETQGSSGGGSGDGDGGRVHAFEPQPYLASLIHHTISLDNHDASAAARGRDGTARCHTSTGFGRGSALVWGPDLGGICSFLK